MYTKKIQVTIGMLHGIPRESIARLLYPMPKSSENLWKFWEELYIASKISKNTGIICKLRHFTPFSTLLNIYQSLIFSYLSYGLVALVSSCQISNRKDISTPERDTAFDELCQLKFPCCTITCILKGPADKLALS